MALLALLAAAGAAAAPKTARIYYAEPVEVRGVPALPASGRAKTGPVTSRFEAFGRRFDLQLESNERVLRKLDAAGQAALPTHALYAGTVTGLPGSWVRLTRLADGLRGLVFDGTELYVLAPVAEVQGQLDVPLSGLRGTETVIYRAADTDGDLGPEFCRVLQPGSSASATPAKTDYRAIFAELQANAPLIGAALPTRELDLALIGDTQLGAQYANTSGEMLARLNNVDGIFSAQVGVKITSGFVKVLTSNGGMTSTAPVTLLDQFDAYRNATPEAASRGLAHLMTGRELDGSTIGIAYLGTLCASQFAVSLSQTYLDTFYSSLVAAHEVGHNFGSPHDGESGSACVATPQTFLMAPAINGSSTFSSCSLSQMSPVVSAARCLTVPKVVDAAVDIAAATLAGFTRQDVHVPVDVTSKGTLAADQVVLTLTSASPATITGATVAGGTCSPSGTGMTCQLGTLAPAAQRQVDVVVRSSQPATVALLANVSASADADARNNSDSVSVSFSSPADGSTTVTPGSVTALMGQPLPFAVTVASSGPQAVQDAVVVIQKPAAFAVASIGGTGASCVVNALDATCTLGTVPAGASRQIDVTMTGTRAWRQALQVSLQSSNDTILDNNSASVTLTAAPLVELTLGAEPGPSVIPLENVVTQSFTLRSIGPQPVQGASFLLSPSPGVEISAISGTGAQCALVTGSTAYRCTYAGAIESGGARQIDAQLRGKTVGAAQAQAAIAAPDSQHLPNGNTDSVTVSYQVRSLVDVRLDAASSYGVFDHKPATLRFDISSLGATPGKNGSFTLTLPTGVRATSAQTTLGTCTFTASNVTCALGTLASGASATVQVGIQSDVTGTYSLISRATADGDIDASNGSVTTSLTVRPNVDVSLAPLPATPHVRQGSAIDYLVTLATATQPATGVLAQVSVGDGVTVLQATPSQGSCEPAAATFTCAMGTIAANGSATITLRVRGDTVGGATIGVRVSSTGDIESGNDSRTGTIAVDARGNVSLAAAAASVAATVGTPFDLPRMTVSAISNTDDVRVTVAVPAAFTIDSATADSATCTVGAGSVACSFGALAAGTGRGITVRLRANQAGTLTVTANAAAADDSDTSDNSTSVTVTASRKASGGSGGGGAFGRDSLLLMLLLAPALARRRAAVTR